MTVCTFAGHREVFSSTVESEIDKALIEIIEADKECVFYSGGMGDDIVVPMELMGVHYKAAIKKRNRWMVDQADKILAYIYRDFGGAFDTVKYAYRMGKPVLNFAVKE